MSDDNDAEEHRLRILLLLALIGAMVVLSIKYLIPG